MSPRDPNTQSAGAHPSRRNIVTAGVWSAPILASAIATPFAAASQQPRVDPTVTRVSAGGNSAQPFDQAPLRYEATSTSTNSAIYQDNSSYNTRIYIRNNGPDTMPAGADLRIVSYVYPASGGYINISSFQGGASALGINSSTMTGGALTFEGTASTSGGTMRRVFTINRPIPAGSEFVIQIEFNVGNLPAAMNSQGGIQADIYAPSGSVDTNTSNNRRINSGDVRYVS